jgi:hypothetical protein
VKQLLLSDMSKEERSLLLYFESRCVDNNSGIDPRCMNENDFKIAKKWNENGFIEFRRVFSGYLTEKLSHYVNLSDDAWNLAHEERQARAERTKKFYRWD